MEYQFNLSGVCINPTNVFVLKNDRWNIQYQHCEVEGNYMFGLRLQYKRNGTYCKALSIRSPKYKSEYQMKIAIKKDISKWLMEMQEKHNIEKLPIGSIQEIVNPQMKLKL